MWPPRWTQPRANLAHTIAESGYSAAKATLHIALW